MRRSVTSFVVAATIALLPLSAWAGNQEVANAIARNLRSSSQLRNYEIEVQYHQGTAWLKGQVRSQAQLTLALKRVFQTEGVRRVVNQLAVKPSPQPKPAVKPQVAPKLATKTTLQFDKMQTAISKTLDRLRPSTKPGAEADRPQPSATAGKPTRPVAEQRSPRLQGNPKPVHYGSPMPRRPTLSKRLKAVIDASAESATPRPATEPAAEPASKPAGNPMRREKPRRASRVPTSFKSEVVQPATALQPEATTDQAQAALQRMPIRGMAPSRQATSRQTAPRQQVAQYRVQRNVPRRPIPVAYAQPGPPAAAPGGPIPAYVAGPGGSPAPARYDQPHMPSYAWPSYAAYPNYAGLTYPRTYSPTAWPYIGPFYPYPQVPLGWRKVSLEWDDGWWMLDFDDTPSSRCCKSNW